MQCCDRQRTRAGSSTKGGGLGLTKRMLPLVLLETPPTNCPRKTDMDTEEITTFGMSICKTPWTRWISCCRRWMWARCNLTQSVLNERINSAKGYGDQISLVPSKTLGTHLSSREFVNIVSRRLGVDVMDSGRRDRIACPARQGGTPRRSTTWFETSTLIFASGVGWDQPVKHQTFSWTSSRVLADAGQQTSCAFHRRPSPKFSHWTRTEPMWLDMAVINVQGQDHWRDTAVRPGSAAGIQSTAKAARNDISNNLADRSRNPGQHAQASRCCREGISGVVG